MTEMTACPERVRRAAPFARRLIVFVLALAAAALPACRTRESLTQERIRAVENGLLRAVRFASEPEKTFKLGERMPFYRVPGAAVAVVDGLEIEWTRTYGITDFTSPAPVTGDTLFQAGAVSQTVAAAVTLALEAQGKIELDADVNSYLRGWKLPAGAGEDDDSPVTIRRLLMSSAGLYPQTFAGYAPDAPPPSLGDVLAGRAPATNAPIYPQGEQPLGVRSEDQDYAVLQKVLEDVTERPFGDLARELVFEPLGMSHSTFALPLPENLRLTAASGHLRQGEPVEGLCRLYPEAAAKGLWTTAADLAAFGLALLRSAMGEPGGILPPESARAMLSPQAGGRGYGLTVSGTGHDLRFESSGATCGFAARLVFYPYKSQGVVVLTNSDNGFVLIDEVLRAVSAVYGWTDFKPEEKKYFRLDSSMYERYVGRYEVSPEYGLDVRWEDYYLVIEPTGQAPTRFYVENPTLFFSQDPYVRIQFLSDEANNVTGLILWQQDFKLEARKVG